MAVFCGWASSHSDGRYSSGSRLSYSLPVRSSRSCSGVVCSGSRLSKPSRPSDLSDGTSPTSERKAQLVYGGLSKWLHTIILHVREKWYHGYVFSFEHDRMCWRCMILNLMWIDGRSVWWGSRLDMSLKENRNAIKRGFLKRPLDECIPSSRVQERNETAVMFCRLSTTEGVGDGWSWGSCGFMEVVSNEYLGWAHAWKRNADLRRDLKKTALIHIPEL